ncbi:MAG: NAD(P)-binding protein [Bacteroidota bacterium]
MTQKKVCIIGAGSSGMVAAKTLKEAGVSYDCYEKGSGIGGNWRYNNDNGVSSAYKSLHINTNREVMAYSDYPHARGVPDVPSPQPYHQVF